MSAIILVYQIQVSKIYCYESICGECDVCDDGFCVWDECEGAGFGMRAGRSLDGADYLSLRYAHWSNGSVNFSLGGFFERSRRNQLRYSCYGTDLLAQYCPLEAGDPLPLFFSWRLGVRATWQMVHEPWLYKALL